MVTERQKPHFAYIECVRGYAILLVIVCHATVLFPELPYPVRRVAEMGWHGVQLFFLASAVTLMMSWRYEQARYGSASVGAFFLRRFFRIAPAYYLASVLYFFLEPPARGFDPVQAGASYLFVNPWSPALMPTTPHAWMVVPGGWSIGVEFTFYAVFPIVACAITSLSRALWLSLATLLIGAALNTWAWPSLQTSFGSTPADNFLYFWFPNQMSVFAFGLCLFHLLEMDRGRRSLLAAYPDLIAAISVVAAIGCGFLGLPHWLNLSALLPPTFVLVSLAMAVFILALARSRSGLFINRMIALTGRVSFSAYLLHFAVLNVIPRWTSSWIDFQATGWSAIVLFAVALVCIVPIVVAVSWCTYRLVEMPMIDVGKDLIRRYRRVAVKSLP